jgi:hypothetical protein
VGNFFRQAETSIRAMQLKANVARLTWNHPNTSLGLCQPFSVQVKIS